MARIIYAGAAIFFLCFLNVEWKSYCINSKPAEYSGCLDTLMPGAYWSETSVDGAIECDKESFKLIAGEGAVEVFGRTEEGSNNIQYFCTLPDGTVFTYGTTIGAPKIEYNWLYDYHISKVVVLGETATLTYQAKIKSNVFISGFLLINSLSILLAWLLVWILHSKIQARHQRRYHY